MKSVIFYLPFLLALFFGSLVRLAGQSTPKWVNYTAGVLIGSFDFEGDYVWVPTQGGLLKMNRTDGTKEIFLPTNSSLQGIDVDEVLVDTGGIKWIGARQGGLMRLDGNHWQRFDTIPTGDTLIQIANLCKDAVGRIWFLSRINNNVNGHDKLFCYDGKQFTRMPSFSTWGYKKIVPDVHGTWIYIFHKSRPFWQ